jgi:nucleoside diphosphate kinase
MREKYTKPDASLYYYLVEWDPEKLSWGSFREKVLGGTDPKTAVDGSLRKDIYTAWKVHGLKSEPNVGDNGMHGSASPFEAMAERLNWVGASLETDPFGKAMLEAGIPKKTVLEWTKDPQVTFEGKKASLFDLLEDTNADACLAKAQKIAGVTPASGARPKVKNHAFVFIKPHAVTDGVKALTKASFDAAGIRVYKEGSLTGPVIEKNLLIDNHYYAIANKVSGRVECLSLCLPVALSLTPHDSSSVPESTLPELCPYPLLLFCPGVALQAQGFEPPRQQARRVRVQVWHQLGAGAGRRSRVQRGGRLREARHRRSSDGQALGKREEQRQPRQGEKST